MVSIEVVLSWVLRTGVMAGAVFMAIGLFAGANVIWLGVFILALTPLLRVIIAGLLFLSQKDVKYFIIALYVISVLVIGILVKF
jgi:uncharacterized membrane protein